jgi:NitT/TauT family transport system substrate-binding protein
MQIFWGRESASWKALFVTVLGILTGVACCDDGQAASGPTPIRIGYSPGVCNASLFVAYEKNFFQAEGLAPQMIQVDAAHISEAVGAGQVDVFQGLASKLVQPLDNGLPAKVVLGLHTGCIKVLVPKDSPIRSVADLKGKRIGVPGLADAGCIIARRALHREGVSVADRKLEVEFAVFGRNDLVQALDKGAVDAIAVGDPVGAIAVQQYGLRVLIDTAVTPPFDQEYCCIALIATKLVRKNPEVAAAVVRALAKASLWVQKHPREAAQLELEKKYVAGNIELNTALLQSYNFNPSVTGGYDALRAVAQELAHIGIIDEKIDGEQFAKEHFVRFAGVPDRVAETEVN